jgi:Lrp/AsnC family transcriptional regulator, regulator for asnA, asnC and gidA
MDDLDQKIIAALKTNSRMSYVEIGTQVGLSEGAVRNRVQTLTANGTIKKFTIEVTNPGTVGSLTMISIEPSTPTSTVTREVQKLNGVEKIYEVTGEYDIITVVSHTNIADINTCIEDIRKIKGVEKTNSIIILKTVES